MWRILDFLLYLFKTHFSGDKVSAVEQIDLKGDALSSSASTQNLTTLLAPTGKTEGGSLTSEERTILELEKQQMYQQLDDKDDEINNQCQLVAKLQVSCTGVKLNI